MICFLWDDRLSNYSGMMVQPHKAIVGANAFARVGEFPFDVMGCWYVREKIVICPNVMIWSATTAADGAATLRRMFCSSPQGILHDGMLTLNEGVIIPLQCLDSMPCS